MASTRNDRLKMSAQLKDEVLIKLVKRISSSNKDYLMSLQNFENLDFFVSF